VVTILAEPIKNDLHILDWQIGLMTGFAFAVFYTVLGLPIARLAETVQPGLDHRRRPLTVWSGFTIACGSAANFVQLILARVGVRCRRGRLHADLPLPDHRLCAQGQARLGPGVLLDRHPPGGLLGTSLGGIMSDAFGMAHQPSSWRACRAWS